MEPPATRPTRPRQSHAHVHPSTRHINLRSRQNAMLRIKHSQCTSTSFRSDVRGYLYASPSCHPHRRHPLIAAALPVSTQVADKPIELSNQGMRQGSYELDLVMKQVSESRCMALHWTPDTHASLLLWCRPASRTRASPASPRRCPRPIPARSTTWRSSERAPPGCSLPQSSAGEE